MHIKSRLLLSVVLSCVGSGVGAQAPVAGIYTCVDAQGRRLTSDRPIPDCTDREQKVLNPSGTVKQKVGPNLTAAERAQQEAREKLDLQERNRLSEALLVRFPNRAAHDAERADALAQITAVSKAAGTRLVELAAQRKKLDDEMEFYKSDPSKAPQYLRRQVEENNQSAAVQKRFIVDQEDEARRVNGRFDDELVRLRRLWPTLK
jgi:Domain of unknown function (DUF4124)